MSKIVEIKEFIKIDRIFDEFKDSYRAVFLDSSLENNLGQFCIIGLNPYLEMEKSDKFIVNGEIKDVEFEYYLDEYLTKNKKENPTNLPLISGCIGYFSYDYAMEKEKINSIHEDKIKIPKVILNFYDNFIIEDIENKKIFVISNEMLKNSSENLNEILEKIEFLYKNKENKKEIKYENKESLTSFDFENIIINSDFTKQDYMKAIEKMINYIIEGDIYVINMTRQLQIKSEIDPYDFFKILRCKNPSPFGAYMNYKDFQIISSSPERFIKLKDNIVTTRPIKGTRKRGKNKIEDDLLRKELENSEKDKSELLMIVDLERNDLNKVCEAGGVIVDELFKIEEYSTVFHLVSDITGKLEKNKNVVDLIKATFPGGSITGCPKYRAMEIIDEVEHSRRNIYTGAIGYISLNGDCDFSIVIRTALYKENIYNIGVGGGITYESETDFEYEETNQKAKALLSALNQNMKSNHIT